MDEMFSTLFTIAKDVKIQVEFNPVKVKAYRLIGYENRKLKKEDFKDDTKDAGEMGAGHTVTALYEIIPAGSKKTVPAIEKLKYQESTIRPGSYKNNEMATVKFRYKDPDGEKSKLIVKSVLNRINKALSENFRFSSAVSLFGMLLRNSKYRGDASINMALDLARNAKEKDRYGYRAEFIKLVEIYSLLTLNDNIKETKLPN